MSEYQCYEFAALERRLSAKELAELREISTRAAWTRLATLVTESRYDDALRVAINLRDLAARDGEDATISTRFEAFRKIHMR